jgi:uracil-DNA glycosylase
VPLFNQLHPDWQSILSEHQQIISSIDYQIDREKVTPPYHQIFRALEKPISSIKVVIFGQDPYPGLGHAHGLAFSVDKSVKPIPASLRNIFEELSHDLAIPKRENPDLSDWSEQGVLLLNRILSTEFGNSLAHKDYGWQTITNSVAEELGKRSIVAILWGKSAGELRRYFRDEFVVESVHPSPLSAYRGFFGSKPFSRANDILRINNISPIDWK